MATKINGIGNPEPLRAAINKILANPKCWDQTSWHCGTTHCFGGHIQIDAGRPEKDSKVEDDLIEILDADLGAVRWLCSGNRKLPELYAFSKAALVGEEYWDRDGYNRDGYNRAGYNRDGYNRDGYNRAGYNRAGYDSAGYNRDGYNRAGYNRDGYDSDGYNRAGYNRDGYNRAGYNRDGSLLQPL